MPMELWDVINTNSDASFMFGTGEIYKEVRRIHEVAINQTIKDEEHIFGKIERRKCGQPAVAPVPAAAQADEAARDVFRRQLGKVLIGQLHTFAHPRGVIKKSDLTTVKMVWNGKFLDIAWRSQCHLINYPTALEEKGCIIGADFKPKAISSRTYKEFMPTLKKKGGMSHANGTMGCPTLIMIQGTSHRCIMGHPMACGRSYHQAERWLYACCRADLKESESAWIRVPWVYGHRPAYYQAERWLYACCRADLKEGKSAWIYVLLHSPIALGLQLPTSLLPGRTVAVCLLQSHFNGFGPGYGENLRSPNEAPTAPTEHPRKGLSNEPTHSRNGLQMPLVHPF
ncbi:hypothetical protein B0H16DRAFT_1472374 [Mycena metata]|uniref:Uncharacterized protein n=1 Tax=Mycena metata TaxID=1033252 RepID=A0AAD7MN64_9AGAR|nr:hypothetical protein B0H16DRAFT_1472374 [Mycena metata]